MFILLEYRGHNLGQQLLTSISNIARELGYKKIRLDTLPGMKTAQKLYRENGFYEIPSYRRNPVDGVLYMERVL